MMESGNPVFYVPLFTNEYYEQFFIGLVNLTNCNESLDKLQCLREVSYDEFNAIVNGTTKINGVPFTTAWNPTIDGDFIQRYTSLQLTEGQFVHVPILDGANSDEGTAFSPIGINDTEDFLNSILTSAPEFGVPTSLANEFLTAYPNDPAVEVVESMGNSEDGPPFGEQFRRSASYWGDYFMIANRRLACQTWASAGLSTFCYRFNAIPAGIPFEIGVTHFQEVSFVFYNIMGVGYIPAAEPPFTGKGENYIRLSQFMDSNWISFVYDLNPNSWRYIPGNWIGQESFWPSYDFNNPQIIVFDANVSSYTESDTFRSEGIQLFIDNNLGIYHR